MKKTIILATLFLLLTSCNQNNFWETNISKDNSWIISADKDNLQTKKLENKKNSENKTSELKTEKTSKDNSWIISTEKNNLKTKEKKETMAKKENVQTAPLKEGDLVATMKTTNGTIKIKLFNDIVPNTVNNFVWLAKQGYYNGIIFHRVINGFMIQWGDPTGTGMWGESIYGEKFRDEFSPELKNIKYSISMANSWENTNGSQFFINQADNNFLDNKHSVFGQVIEWMENVDKIAKAKTWAQDKPKKEIKIIDLKIEEYNGKTLEKFDFDKEKAIKEYEDSIKSEMEAKKAALKAKREKNKNKVLANWDTVSVHYTLTVDGKKIDSSLDRGQPFTFTLGKKMVIKGWDEGLIGHKVGDKFKLEVSPKDGYGEYDKNKTQVIPREQLAEFEKAGIKLEKWAILPTQVGNLKILKATDKEITIDANHELAGKTLNFDIEIVDIK